MHWILMKDELPIQSPFSMKGFATIKEPGCPPRTEYGYFHSGRDVYDWEKNPRPYMVKAKYYWEDHIPITKYDIVFCKETHRDEEGIHYYVYPQPWIVAWMPEITPYSEDFPDCFTVELEGTKFYVEYPEFEMTSERMQMSDNQLIDNVKFHDRVYKERFLEVIKRGT